VLAEEQAGPVEAMAAAVRAHALASRLFTGGVAEGVARMPYEGVASQIRIDYLHPAYGIIDLKTTESLDWFESDCRKYGYIHQLAFYRGVLALAAGMPSRHGRRDPADLFGVRQSLERPCSRRRG